VTTQKPRTLALPVTAHGHERQHIERLVDAMVLKPSPKTTVLLYDKAADSDPLRWRLASRGITLVAPFREDRTDGRRLHYRHERLLRKL
jgi:hypothetical protein